MTHAAISHARRSSRDRTEHTAATTSPALRRTPEPQTLAPRLRSLALAIALFLLVASAQALERFDARIPMRDGKWLAADVYLPDRTQPWPTVLIMTPYGRTIYRSEGIPLDMEHYAYVVVDWRGYFGSWRARNPEASNGEDGYDCVEWIATQPWSNTRVGMWGSSALGVIQFETAREQPPHLQVCVPRVADYITDYNQYYPGGVLREEYVDFLGLYYGLESIILAHPSRDRYWRATELLTGVTRDYGVPMLMMSGWYDLDPTGIISAFERLRNGSKPAVRDQHRLLMGPWTHGGLETATQGELTFNNAARTAEAAAVAFLDHYLRDLPLNLPTDDAIGWYEMGTNRWRSTDQWPPAGVRNVPLYLQPDATLTTAPPTVADAASTLNYDPRDPSPTHGGNVLRGAPVGPRDQRAIVESRGDNLIFTTEPLDTDVTIAGAGRVTLFVSTDRLDTDFMVRLTEVYPDGTSMLITDGAIRGRFREGVEREVLMNPGEIVPVEIVLPDTAATFRAGHRIRIIITSSNFPRFHANPNDGGPLYDRNAQPVPALNSVYHDATRPSKITLPVLSN